MRVPVTVISSSAPDCACAVAAVRERPRAATTLRSHCEESQCETYSTALPFPLRIVQADCETRGWARYAAGTSPVLRNSQHRSPIVVMRFHSDVRPPPRTCQQVIVAPRPHRNCDFPISNRASRSGHMKRAKTRVARARWSRCPNAAPIPRRADSPRRARCGSACGRGDRTRACSAGGSCARRARDPRATSGASARAA